MREAVASLYLTKGQRLQVCGPGEINLGGWCLEAAQKCVVETLLANTAHTPTESRADFYERRAAEIRGQARGGKSRHGDGVR